MRLHKPFGPGWEGIGDEIDGTRLTPQGLDRMDYFMAKLKEHGIYYGLSHTYGYRIRPGNRDRYLAYDEIAKRPERQHYGLMNFAEDVQDLMIEMVVGALRHRNPYTGQTWADEPALAYIELQNEDDIFFYTTENVLGRTARPTARTSCGGSPAGSRPSTATQAELAKAWHGAITDGRDARAGQHRRPRQSLVLRRRPAATPGGQRTRLLDNAAFLHDVQNRFYGRFVKAIRATGYQGPLCGSPWQAPAMVPHYYNLRSDYLVGWIDRHNYFGGNLCRHDARPAGQRLPRQRLAAGGRPAVRDLGMDPRLSFALQRRRAGDLRRLRHGPARLELLIRVPIVVQPRGMERDRGKLPLGRLERRHAHPDRPVSAPGADGDARRRQARARSFPRAASARPSCGEGSSASATRSSSTATSRVSPAPFRRRPWPPAGLSSSSPTSRAIDAARHDTSSRRTM